MHHTRKNRSLKKKTKALKKSRSKRSLKKKSNKTKKSPTKTRKVNKRRIRGGDGKKTTFEITTNNIRKGLNDYKNDIENAGSKVAKDRIVGITKAYLNNDKHDVGCTGKRSLFSKTRQAYQECHADKYTIYNARAELGQQILASWSKNWGLNQTENTTKTNLKNLIQIWLTLAKKKDPEAAAEDAKKAKEAEEAEEEAEKAKNAAEEAAAEEARRIEYQRIIDMGEKQFFRKIPQKEVEEEEEEDYTYLGP